MRCVRIIPSIFAGLLVMGTATAQPVNSLTGIELHGATSFTATGSADSYKSNFSEKITADDLKALANQLSAECQSQGYILCRAEIPRQDISDGYLSINISEGYITKLDVPADLRPMFEKIFADVMRERPLTDRTFYRTVALLDDIPGLTVRGITPERIADNAYALKIDAEYKRMGLRGLVSNRGSRRDKPFKAFLGGEIGSILKHGDLLSGGYLMRPEAPDELAFIRARYDTAPSKGATKAYIELAWSNSSPASQLANRDVEGYLKRMEVGVQRPILRREGLRIDGRVSMEIEDSSEEEQGLSLYTDKLRIVQGTLLARAKLPSRALLVFEASISQGLGIWEAGGGSRPDGDAEFGKLQFEATVGKPFFDRFVGRLGITGQRATGPLLFSEEFGLGGGSYGRAYDFGEVMGDHGAAAYFELAQPLSLGSVVSRMEPYVYADAGATWNAENELTADGKTLFSAGGGVRLTGKHGWTLSYEAAYPLSDAPYTLEDDEVRHRIDIGYRR